MPIITAPVPHGGGKPLITLQRRLVEVGRLRLGEKKKTAEGKSYPSKLAKWRVTSKDRQRLDAVAQIYGGQVREWEDQFEVYTTSDAIDIAVVPGQALSQYMEHWGQEHPKSHKGPNPVICLRRCDGQTCQLLNPRGRGWIEEPCQCALESELTCKMTTRLSVMLTQIPGLGVWRVESKGKNAGVELAGTVHLLEALIATGRPVRARLRVEIVTAVSREGTFKYPKPILDIDHTPDQVVQMIGGPNGELGDGSDGELAAGPAFGKVPELPEGPSPSIAEQLEQTGKEGPGRARSNAAEPIKATGRKPRARGGAVVEEESGSDEAAVAPSPAPAGGGAGTTTVAAEAPASPPPTDRDDPVAKQRATQVARYCRDDGGITDDGLRHAFLQAFSQGAWSSSYDVPVEAIASMRAALVRLRRGELRLEDREGRPQLIEVQFGWESTRPTRGGEAMQPASDDEAGEWGLVRWLREAENVPGIGQAKLLKKARSLAGDLGVDVPGDLDHVTDPALVEALLGWLREQQAA